MDIIVVIFLLVTTALLYILWQQIQQQNKRKPKLDRSLDKRLLMLLGGDTKAALRLLRSARKHHPNRSYLWYYEKVIRDLEGDRR